MIICPLLMQAVTMHAGYVSSEDFQLQVDCTSGCAWYDEKKKQCDRKSERQALEDIVSSIRVLAQKISVR